MHWRCLTIEFATDVYKRQDMYYFEESQAVSGSALLELGFFAIHSQYYTITVNGFTINYKIVNGSGAFFIDDKKIQVKTLEQIYTLILLL